MAVAQLAPDAGQIPMPGMPNASATAPTLNPRAVAPGQFVRYHGRVRGGPRFGVIGRVTGKRARQAVVDMGPFGTWHVPYYLLTA